MMKKRMKQLLALALSATMMAFVAGCGSTRGESKSSESEVSQDSQSSTSVEESTVENSTEEVVADITYPLTTDVVLTAWAAGGLTPAAEYTDYTQSPFHTGLAEKTGVDIKWTFPVTGVSATEAWNLLQTEKELPDIILRAWDATEAELLINDGSIYDLTEYLPKYAPDYWEIINRPEYIYSLKSMTTPSGKIFVIGSFPDDSAAITYQGPVVRKDWLDECGLGIPVTTEDWEAMLIAFKEKYEIAPFGMAKSSLTGVNIASATGAYYGMAANYAIVDDKVVYSNAQPEWKEYLTLMNKWWNEGLLDRDSVTMDTAALRSKAANGELGVIFAPLSNLTNFNADAETNNTGAEWIAIGYPREAEGAATSMIQTRAQHWANNGVAFSTSLSEEELITALQWANYGYTEEGMMYWNFGKEGVSYTLNAAGEPEFTDVVTKDVNGINDGLKKYTGVYSSGISLQKLDYTLLKNGEVGGNAIKVWTENTEGPSHALPSIPLSEDETLIYKNLGAQIHTYTGEMALKFMNGEESLDNFDAFLQKLDSMGLQQLLKVWQGAFDRYMAQ